MKKKTPVENRYAYSRRQRVLAWLALIGIFVCGMMAGAFIWQTKTTHTTDSAVQTEIDACQKRESALLAKLNKNIDDSDWRAYEQHEYNMHIYQLLNKNGCPGNKAEYARLAESEESVASVLAELVGGNSMENKPCEIIEKTLAHNVLSGCRESDCYLNNAEVYSKMAEDGCPENAENYKRLALNELQIAEGVRINEADVNKGEIRSTVNTYKKLQMQQEAKKYLNKVEKLVNPGIDFIMELQRVIEE